VEEMISRLPEQDRGIARRLLAKVEINPDTGCWIWTATRNDKGYGQMWVRGAMRSAHRTAYTLWVGPVEPGLVLDHFKCSTRECCNPEHVRPVTVRENNLRSEVTLAAIAAAATVCPAGHPYTGENLLIDSDGHRRCAECRRDTRARYRDRVRARKAAARQHPIALAA
jgi:hypothetical protein